MPRTQRSRSINSEQDHGLGDSVYQVYPRIGVNNVRHFSGLQFKRSIFEWFLHLPMTEGAQITATLCRAAITELTRNLLETFLLFRLVQISKLSLIT